MSHGNSQSSDDVVELALEFQGLQISVRGSSSASLEFVRRVSELHNPPVRTVFSAPPASSWSVVSSPRAETRQETRASIEAGFPDLPAHLRLLSSSLGQQSSRLSATERLDRAWKAGCWAKAKLQGRVQSPNRTPTIDLGNRAYAIIRGPGVTVPKIVNSSAELFATVGELSGTDTICHGFPSKTEARVYIAAVDAAALAEA